MNKDILSEMWTKIKNHELAEPSSGPPQPFLIGDRWDNGIMFIGICPGSRGFINESPKLKEMLDEFWVRDIPFERGNYLYEQTLRLVPAGKFIRDIIGEDWSNTVYTNLVKNPVKDNRQITQQDIALWEKILLEQIKLFKPKLIVAFGVVVATTLFKNRTQKIPIHQILNYNGTDFVLTYHYSFTLRTGSYHNQISTLKEIITKSMRNENKGLISSY